SISSEALVGLAGVIFGSLLTTLGVWLTNRANRRHLKIQLAHEERLVRQRVAKERLEELYVLVCHWLQGLFENHLHLMLVMKGSTDYNKYLDSVLAMKSRDISRLEMIIDVYGESVQPSYAAVLKARTSVNEIAAAHKEAYLRGEPGVRFIDPFTRAQVELEA